jgi:hypothetical protein
MQMTNDTVTRPEFGRAVSDPEAGEPVLPATGRWDLYFGSYVALSDRRGDQRAQVRGGSITIGEADGHIRLDLEMDSPEGPLTLHANSTEAVRLAHSGTSIALEGTIRTRKGRLLPSHVDLHLRGLYRIHGATWAAFDGVATTRTSMRRAHRSLTLDLLASARNLRS